MKYLGDADVPLWAKVAFGGGSIVFSGAVLFYAVRHARALAASVREKVRSLSGWLLAAAGLALLGAQMVDKHRTTDAYLGTNLSAWDLKDYLEESLEIVGPMLLVAAVVLAILEEPAGAPEASDPPRVPSS
jgi:hypothetical protein